MAPFYDVYARRWLWRVFGFPKPDPDQMLTVAIELHGDIVAIVMGISQNALNRPANAEIEGKGQDSLTGVVELVGCGISGGIIDDENLHARSMLFQIGNDRSNTAGLVEGRNKGYCLRHCASYQNPIAPGTGPGGCKPSLVLRISR